MEKSVKNSLPESHMYLEQQGWVNDKLTSYNYTYKNHTISVVSVN